MDMRKDVIDRDVLDPHKERMVRQIIYDGVEVL